MKLGFEFDFTSFFLGLEFLEFTDPTNLMTASFLNVIYDSFTESGIGIFSYLLESSKYSAWSFLLIRPKDWITLLKSKGIEPSEHFWPTLATPKNYLWNISWNWCYIWCSIFLKEISFTYTEVFLPKSACPFRCLAMRHNRSLFLWFQRLCRIGFPFSFKFFPICIKTYEKLPNDLIRNHTEILDWKQNWLSLANEFSISARKLAYCWEKFSERIEI